MLVELLNLVNLKSEYILGERGIERLNDFLNGFAVAPKSNWIIAFNRTQFCLDVSNGEDMSCDIKKVLKDKSKTTFDAYDLFYEYIDNRYEITKKNEKPLPLCLGNIYEPPVNYAMATLYHIPGFVLDCAIFSSLTAFMYGYFFNAKMGQLADIQCVNLDKMFYEIETVMEELDGLAGNQVDEKQKWDVFFLNYENELRKMGNSLSRLFLEKKRQNLKEGERHYFW